MPSLILPFSPYPIAGLWSIVWGMVTVATIALIVLGALLVPDLIMGAFALWGVAAWVATKGGPNDTNNLAAWIFLFALCGIGAEIFL